MTRHDKRNKRLFRWIPRLTVDRTRDVSQIKNSIYAAEEVNKLY